MSTLQVVLAPVLFAIERSRAGPTKTFKSVLITGASSGLGAGLAIAYAKPGVLIAITGRNKERLEAVAQKCKDKGAQVFLGLASLCLLNRNVQVEIGLVDVVDAKNLAEFILKVDAIVPLDLVIANAGITGVSEGSKEGYTFQQSISDVTNINVLGVTNTILPIIPKLCERKAGQVVIMGSLSGYMPFQLAPDYGATKAAVSSLSRALRPYLASFNVGMTLITPGFVRTDLLQSTEKYPFEISLDEVGERETFVSFFFFFFLTSVISFVQATPIMLDGIARNVNVLAFPFVPALITTMLGRWDPITLSVLGPVLFTRMTKKITKLVTGQDVVSTKKSKSKTN